MPDHFLFADDSVGGLRRRNPIQESAGEADAGRIAALGANGRFHPSMIPGGVGGGTGSLYWIKSDETVTVAEGQNLLIVDELIVDGELILDGRLIEVGA